MWQLLILGTLLLGCACAYTDGDVQSIKSVKGGYGGSNFQNFDYNSAISRFNQNYTGQGSYGMRYNMTGSGYSSFNMEIGVCYIEVPTASLVRDPAHVPPGNGSRPDLSRIRTCCKGYIRNIHNFRICDPVCTQECVNALCTAPDTCTCFPDHVKNLAGFCIPTCPIGCQNGQCAGGECLCKDGYTLDSDGKYCLPRCRGNCGGIGNCTAPDTCTCRTGYQSTLEGSCKAICSQCTNGECVAPNECRCLPGFGKDQRGLCIPTCSPGCGTNGRCVSPNVCQFPSTTVLPNPYLPNQQQPSSYGQNSQYGNQGHHLYPPSTGLSGDNRTPNSGNLYPNLYPGQQPPNPSNQPSNYPTNFGQQPHYYPPSSGLSGDNNSPNTGNSYPGQQINFNYPPNSNQPSYNSYRPPQQQPNYPNSGQEWNLYPSYPGQNPLNSANLTAGGAPCTKMCINGLCVEGDRCSCLHGYVLDVTDASGTRCIPSCPGGCTNGVCSAPNFCICNMGYVKDHSVKGRQSCIRRIRRSAAFNQLVFEIPAYD